MDHWDEVRTAYQVARNGTVSGAAEVLGVHHATVIRHVDALEGRLGVKLFQRHPRGYTATEAGQDLLQVAQATDDQFAQLAGRLKGQGEGVTGDLVVTALPGLAELLVPVLTRFQAENPGIVVRHPTGARVFRLEYGEAHVAIRAGPAPQEPDNVVQPLATLQMVMVAAPDYIARHGRPESLDDLAGHRFVGPEDYAARAPHFVWLMARIDTAQVAFRVNDERAGAIAVRHGAAIGFVARPEMQARDDLVPLFEDVPEWQVPLWIVTHVDLHRSAKVQRFLAFLKEEAKDWPC